MILDLDGDLVLAMEELEFTELGTDDTFVSMLRQSDEDPPLVLPELECSENGSELSLRGVTELSETEPHGVQRAVMVTMYP